MVIKELFINLSILITSLFVYTQILGPVPLSIHSPVKKKVLAGLYGGILSNILMYFSMNIHTVILDLRQIPNILLVYFGGAIPVTVSIVLTSLGRFFISVDISAYLSILFNIFVAIFIWHYARLSLHRQKRIFVIITFTNLILSIILIYMVKYSVPIIKALTTYWMILYVSVYLAFAVLCYFRRNQMLFQQYKHDAMIDGLTGLKNTRAFDQEFNKYSDQVKGNKQKLSLLYIDIDFFKKINDTYGHLLGDMVLREVGIILQRSTRNIDVVSRNGGEEFTVLLVDCPLNLAIETAEKIRKNIEKTPFRLQSGKSIHLTVSIGVSCYGETTSNLECLIADADQALFQAKSAGRNKLFVAHEKSVKS